MAHDAAHEYGRQQRPDAQRRHQRINIVLIESSPVRRQLLQRQRRQHRLKRHHQHAVRQRHQYDAEHQRRPVAVGEPRRRVGPETAPPVNPPRRHRADVQRRRQRHQIKRRAGPEHDRRSANRKDQIAETERHPAAAGESRPRAHAGRHCQQYRRPHRPRALLHRLVERDGVGQPFPIHQVWRQRLRPRLLRGPQCPVDDRQRHHIPGVAHPQHHQQRHHRSLRQLQPIHPLQQPLARYPVGQIADKGRGEKARRHRGEGNQSYPGAPVSLQLRDAIDPRSPRHNQRPGPAAAAQRRHRQKPKIPKHQRRQKAIRLPPQIAALRPALRR